MLWHKVQPFFWIESDFIGGRGRLYLDCVAMLYIRILIKVEGRLPSRKIYSYFPRTICLSTSSEVIRDFYFNLSLIDCDD